MKKISKVMMALLLLSGCNAFKSTTQQLAGRYMYKDENYTMKVVLKEPSSKDETSGECEVEDDEVAYEGKYTVDEDTKTVNFKIKYGYFTEGVLKFKYDLSKGQLIYTSKKNMYHGEEKYILTKVK